MPAAKCTSCSRWSFQNGCTLHSYALMRDCMMDKKNFYRNKENVYDHRNDESVPDDVEHGQQEV
jgi:hypothetical protein